RHFFDDLSQVLSQFTNPQSNPGGNGSGDPQLPQFFQENGNGDLPIPFTNFAPTNGTNNPATTTTTFTVVPFAETVQPTIVIAGIETNNTFIATNNIINQVEAAAGVLISGTAAGSNIVGQTVTVDIINASHTVVESFTTTVHPNGTWSVDVTPAQAQGLPDGIYTVTASIPGGTGGHPATASQTVTVDQDLSEQAALKLTVSDTDVGHSAAAAVAFTIAGLDPEDTGTVTFTDGHTTVVVPVTGGTTNYTANLSSLTDGTITSSLQVATDPAGNTFTPVAGTTITLDQDLSEHPSVLVDNGSTTPIGRTGATAVAFAVSGLDTDDSGTLTFSDSQDDSVTVTIIDGQVVAGAHNTTTTVDLSGLANEQTITSSLSVTDPAGNVFSASGNAVTLDLVAPKVAFTSEHENGESWTLTGTDSDVGGSGVQSVQIFEGSASGTLLGTATLNGNGTWSLTTAPLADGILTFVAEVTDKAGNAATASVTVDDRVPAGVAGNPINLALTDPSGGQATGPITLTFTGVPSDWSLNEGTNLGNGRWTVQMSDLSALTVLTAAAYTGAMVLGVTETWTNANGSTGIAFVSDNVEAYAPGTPIFALSGNDTLTGAGANDVFVFAQPIGNDAIYNFNVATDKIDLTGFANIASFHDIKGSIASDSNGDAVITVGAGETITLHGVDAASLTAADFVFNQTPVVTNAGNMVVSDGAVLPLSGTIDNTGTIALNSSGDHTELQIIGAGVTLEGGGQLILSDNAANTIVGTGPNDTLTNVDNTIAGAGQIGSGDGTLTLVNEAHGTIEANDAGGTLTLETGTTITNNGVLEALNGGTLQILDPVTGSGSAIIAGGTVIFDAPSNMHVTFNNGTGTPTYGELVLGDASGFSGQISGFAGTAPDVAHSDAIDLVGINYNSSAFSETYNSSNGLLTVTDGTHAASFTFDNFNGTLSFASDGNGGTLITDPPAPNSSNMSVSIGGPGNDTFVFKPDIGADTIVNFNPQADTIELDHFANVHNVQQLAAAITADAHGDAMIALGHGDSIDIPGVTPSYLQAHLQSLVHLH
uniref:beta strand repeat-containing protein n=1 Tax=Mycobacterium sp. TaxID=1785 RepID=UPI003F9E7153